MRIPKVYNILTKKTLKIVSYSRKSISNGCTLRVESVSGKKDDVFGL